jgi:hypothetical protein
MSAGPGFPDPDPPSESSVGPSTEGGSTGAQAADEMLAALGIHLAEEISTAMPGWVERCVTRVLPDAAGSESLASATAEAGSRAATEVGERLRSLLGRDVDEQWTTPLAVLREAVLYPTAVLQSAGAPPVGRDQYSSERFPDDVYGLTPASIAAVAIELGPIALAWGAAKAMAHRIRHGG